MSLMFVMEFDCTRRESAQFLGADFLFSAHGRRRPLSMSSHDILFDDCRDYCDGIESGVRYYDSTYSIIPTVCVSSIFLFWVKVNVKIDIRRLYMPLLLTMNKNWATMYPTTGADKCTPPFHNYSHFQKLAVSTLHRPPIPKSTFKSDNFHKKS